VIVAHGNVFLLAAGTRPPEGGAAIVRADGRGGFVVQAILEPGDWSRLLEIPVGAVRDPHCDEPEHDPSNMGA
jgi:hypothetical protein